jgi:hypothetical protein
MIHRRHRPAALAALLSLVLVAGCGSTGPSARPATSSSQAPGASASPPPASSSAPTAETSSPAASAATSCPDTTATASFSPQPIGPYDPNAAVFDQIETAVQAIRGITAERKVPRSTLDQAGMCAFVRDELNRSNPPDVVAVTGRLYKQLGLIDEGASLESEVSNLLASQVIGAYDPTSKQMFVLSSTGEIGPLEQFTYAHEFDHALQDQAFDLAKIRTTATDQGDRALARTALIEGDATLLMSLWARLHLTAQQLIQVASAADPASQAALNAAPPILKETLLWPYTQGLSLTLGAYQTSASFAGVDALWADPPDTTEQVIHPDKLASREPAVPVSFPADFAQRLGAGWKVAMQDTLGELQLNILIRTGNPQAGTDPAAGWGGDRVALVEGPSGATAAVVDTVWDTPAAAGGVLDQLGHLVTVLNSAGKHAAVLAPSAQRVVLISADSDATLGAVANVLGLAS